MLSRWPLISARGRQQLEVDDMMNPQFLLSDTSRPVLLSDISRPVFANMETLIEKVFGKKPCNAQKIDGNKHWGSFQD